MVVVGNARLFLPWLPTSRKKKERGGNLFALFTVCGRGKRRVVVNAFNFFSYPISFLFCVAVGRKQIKQSQHRGTLEWGPLNISRQQHSLSRTQRRFFQFVEHLGNGLFVAQKIFPQLIACLNLLEIFKWLKFEVFIYSLFLGTLWCVWGVNILGLLFSHRKRKRKRDSMFACHSIKEVNPLFIFLRVCQKGATKQQPSPLSQTQKKRRGERKTSESQG